MSPTKGKRCLLGPSVPLPLLVEDLGSQPKTPEPGPALRSWSPWPESRMVSMYHVQEESLNQGMLELEGT